jgi:hypothetical protein
MMDNKAFQNIQKKLALTNEGISEAMDVELFTVRQWASGIWPVPRPIAKFLRTLLSMKRNKKAMDYNIKGVLLGYDRGYAKGFDAAIKEIEEVLHGKIGSNRPE